MGVFFVLEHAATNKIAVKKSMTFKHLRIKNLNVETAVFIFANTIFLNSKMVNVG
jgi:hypothetical protein